MPFSRPQDTSLSVKYKALRARVRNLVEQKDHTDTWALHFAGPRIVYIPVPKAANSSIRRALLPLVDVRDVDVPRIQAFEGFDKLRTSELSGIVNNDWFTFTVVRDPYSRFVSAYQNKITWRPKVLPAFAAMGATRDDSIETFARMVRRWPVKLLNDHIMPQSLLLSRAMQLPRLKVFHMEDLDREWATIRADISQRSGRAIAPLGRSNATTEGPHWTELLTPEVRALIDEIYAADFVAFGYTKRS
ncbi:MAG: sulfotransferase family 2 domain-containing protein [Devosia sp.]